MKNIIPFAQFNLLEGKAYAVSIDRLFASKKSMRQGASDMRSQHYSHTPGALSVWKSEDGELHIVDGYHRLWEALILGKKWLMVHTSGSGYSEYWKLASGTDKIQFDSSLRYGGLEMLDISIDSLQRMRDAYIANKGDSVLDFPVDMPTRKPSAPRKPVDKLKDVRELLYNLKSIRMAPDMVNFAEMLKLLKKQLPKFNPKLVQEAVDAIVTHDNSTFFVKLDEMAEWGVLFNKFVNKTIYDKGLKADQFVLANWSDRWLSKLVNSEAR